MSDSERFEFAWARAYRGSALFGVLPSNVWLEVDDVGIRARFGLWRIETTHDNIADVEVTGPYAWWKTAGPARLGVTDGGITFATNGERGVLISFHRKVHSKGPTRMIPHPELTVTVADPDRLVELLRSKALSPT